MCFSHNTHYTKLITLNLSILFLLWNYPCNAQTSPAVPDQLASSHNAAPAGDIPQTAWPASWFKAPRKASSLGLKTFHQSPLLDSLVAVGALAPVEERLSNDPIVVEPIDTIGHYGGTAKLFHAGETLINLPEGPLRVGPQLRLTVPNFAEKAIYSDSARTLTITLRPGHKWSDGHAATADDFVFWFEHVQMNKQLTPVVEPRFKGARIEQHGPYSFSYHWPQPQPLFVKHMAHSGWRLSLPAHFMRRYHPSFTDPEQIKNEAKELGLQDWRTYFEVVSNTRDLMVFNRPVKTAYIVVSKTSTRSVYKRNPYYPKVDPQGNQLPYMDYLELQRVDSPEIMTAKASTGQISFAGRQFKTADIPLFKRFEKDNAYSTYIWPRPYGSDIVLFANMTHPDIGLRTIFQDPYSSLNPRMPVLDLIAEPLKAHGWDGPACEHRVTELMELVGLDPRYIRRYPHAFSGGQRQRIGIARALALSPSLIVADEPVSALDVSVQAQILNLLQALQAELDLTLLFVAHDLSVVRYLCDKVAVMYQGRLVEQATTEELFTHPRHPYTAMLLNAAPAPDPHAAWMEDEDEDEISDKDLITTPDADMEGCPFVTRCRYQSEQCWQNNPPLEDTTTSATSSHMVACHHTSEIELKGI